MSTQLKFFICIAFTFLLLWLLVSLSTALLPFILAAVFAYITLPLASFLESCKLSTTLSASLIVILLIALLLFIPFAFLPLVASQIQQLLEFLPKLVDWSREWLGENSHWINSDNFNVDKIFGAADAGKAAQTVLGVFSDSLSTITNLFLVLLITPMSVFYFLRDRKSIVGEITEMLPPYMRDRLAVLARDLDNVLGEFLHGQLLVMVIMSVFYTVVLSLSGLNFSLTVGVVSGMLVFIPYVGFLVGFVLATLVALTSFESWVDIFIVWALMGIGNVMESILITPRIIGERVGLHPMMILIALLVMGELFGFTGILISLPVVAALLVIFRHLRRYYINSDFYGQN